MNLVPKREYVVLLAGDLIVFTLALWLTLAVRYLSIPSLALFDLHIIPFSLLFLAWVVVFFFAGLYGKHTRLLRSRLMTTIFYTQTLNLIIAALFFFFVPAFGLAPKTILILYLFVSSPIIFLWRVGLYPSLRGGKKLRGVLLASGHDAKLLAEEVAHGRYPFVFDYIVDTKKAPSHEVIQRACRIIEEDDVTFLVVDFSDAAVSAALPIVYDAAFRKQRFALLDAAELFKDIFERVPLSLIDYEWILANVSASRVYDILKRLIDIVGSIVIGIISLIFYPFVILAIKIDDGGDVFISLPRVGRYQETIHILKFRSMTGNDGGDYGATGKSKLQVTRVGKWIRLFRIDELPQVWNILRGDLSFVGPRPETPSLAAQYNARIPYYNARALVAPGLMGWAQLRHDQHPHHRLAVEETKEKLSYDLYYMKHRSLLLDIYIMLQTVRIILTARGS